MPFPSLTDMLQTILCLVGKVQLYGIGFPAAFFYVHSRTPRCTLGRARCGSGTVGYHDFLYVCPPHHAVTRMKETDVVFAWFGQSPIPSTWHGEHGKPASDRLLTDGSRRRGFVYSQIGLNSIQKWWGNQVSRSRLARLRTARCIHVLSYPFRRCF